LLALFLVETVGGAKWGLKGRKCFLAVILMKGWPGDVA
jgi:hypothetical protein